MPGIGRVQGGCVKHVYGIMHPIPGTALLTERGRHEEDERVLAQGDGAGRVVPSQVRSRHDHRVGRERGAQQFPGTVAKGAGVVAWLKDGGRGPKPMRAAQGRCWQRLKEWMREGR